MRTCFFWYVIITSWYSLTTVHLYSLICILNQPFFTEIVMLAVRVVKYSNNNKRIDGNPCNYLVIFSESKMAIVSRVVKPKSKRAKRALEKREPKAGIWLVVVVVYLPFIHLCDQILKYVCFFQHWVIEYMHSVRDIYCAFWSLSSSNEVSGSA